MKSGEARDGNGIWPLTLNYTSTPHDNYLTFPHSFGWGWGGVSSFPGRWSSFSLPGWWTDEKSLFLMLSSFSFSSIPPFPSISDGSFSVLSAGCLPACCSALAWTSASPLPFDTPAPLTMTFAPEVSLPAAMFPNLLMPPDLSLELQTHLGPTHLDGHMYLRLTVLGQKQKQTKKNHTEFRQER